MAEPWFYLNRLPEEIGAIANLPPEEARHLGAARRLGPGDALVLCDGAGGLAHAVALAAPRGEARVRILEFERRPSPLPSLHLASALPKGERVGQLLSMATQLGMTSFQPLLCERSVARPRPSAPERWRRITREACKQSRRAHLPEFADPKTPRQVAQQAAAAGEPALLFDPSGSDRARALLADDPLRKAPALHLLVGPEGGFTTTEIDEIRALDARTCVLSAGVLRCETACAAALSIFGLLRV